VKRHGPRSLCLELDGTAVLGDKNFDLKDGIIFETKATPQVRSSAQYHTIAPP
jgi:hypothetical protein